jgi:hypothetical protein
LLEFLFAGIWTVEKLLIFEGSEFSQVWEKEREGWGGLEMDLSVKMDGE